MIVPKEKFMSGNMNKIGNNLIQHAEKTKVTARGLAEELFPYIYVASKRMSTRAISEWLEKEHNVQISFVTIAKMLRKSPALFDKIVDEVYAAADTLEIHCNYDDKIANSSKLTFLFNEEYFEQITTDMTVELGKDINIGTILYAIQKLKDEWFALPQEVRDQCENLFITRDTQRYDESRKAEIKRILKDKINESSTEK